MGGELVSFLLLAGTLALVPGPEAVAVERATLRWGRRRGAWCAAGVACAALAEGVAVALGLAGLAAAAPGVLALLRWAAVYPLVFVALQAIRLAVLGRYPLLEDLDVVARPAPGRPGFGEGARAALRHPRALVFGAVAVPLFAGPDVTVAALLPFGVGLAGIALVVGVLLSVVLDAVRRRRLGRGVADLGWT